MKLLRRLCAFFGLAFASGLFAADALDGLIDPFAADWMRLDPESATAPQYFTGAEQDALDCKLTPISEKFRAERVLRAQQGLAELKKFDQARLNPAQRISAAMLERAAR